MNEKPEKIRQILAQNIKMRREKLGFSQEKLAEITDLSVQSINTIEGCRMWVSDKTISRLAKALKIEVFQLFIPYQGDKRESGVPSALLELRQKVMNDVENINDHIDSRFNEALKKYS
jgi:transcriptional regulator with XRE-family HTH domain